MRVLIWSLLSLQCITCFAQVQPAFENVISDLPNVRDLTISVFQDEAYMTTQSPMGELSAILKLKQKDGQWQSAEVASFSGRYHDIEPFLSSDALTLYFASNRPLDGISDEIKDYDIWYVERASLSAPWSEPINFGTPVNTAGNEFYPVVTNNNNLYFTGDGEGTKGRDDIFFAAYAEGDYATPISLDSTINSPGYEFNAFIAPDESYMLFTGYNRSDGLGSGDLYISKRDADGHWSLAENISEINSAQMDYCPFVDVNSGLMYFTSRRSGIQFTADKRNSLSQLKKRYQQYDNGQSRIYQYAISEILK